MSAINLVYHCVCKVLGQSRLQRSLTDSYIFYQSSPECILCIESVHWQESCDILWKSSSLLERKIYSHASTSQHRANKSLTSVLSPTWDDTWDKRPQWFDSVTVIHISRSSRKRSLWSWVITSSSTAWTESSPLFVQPGWTSGFSFRRGCTSCFHREISKLIDRSQIIFQPLSSFGQSIYESL